MIGYLRVFVHTFVEVVSWLLMAYCIVSWILPPYNRIRSYLEEIMGMFLNPIRRFLPTFGMMDFSPIVLMLILQFLESTLLSILR